MGGVLPGSLRTRRPTLLKPTKQSRTSMLPRCLIKYQNTVVHCMLVCYFSKPSRHAAIFRSKLSRAMGMAWMITQGEDPIACPTGTYNPLLQQDHQDNCKSCPAGQYCYVEVRTVTALFSSLVSYRRSYHGNERLVAWTGSAMYGQPAQNITILKRFPQRIVVASAVLILQSSRVVPSAAKYKST